MPLERDQIRELLIQELPALLERDPEVQRLILQLAQKYFAGRSETDNRFDRILEELRQSREEQTRLWAEQAQRWEEQAQRWAEQAQRWAEQAQRWEEQDRRWEENQREIRELMRRHAALDRKFDSTIGALGARWGLYSEQSFRDALRGILTGFFNLEVINVNEFDETGEVFGRPEQIELDVIIKNGLLLICEIKSSMSKADMYLFERKARWYERRHERRADQLIVISPMVDVPARKVAERFGIVVYSFAEDAGDALTSAER